MGKDLNPQRRKYEKGRSLKTYGRQDPKVQFLLIRRRHRLQLRIDIWKGTQVWLRERFAKPSGHRKVAPEFKSLPFRGQLAKLAYALVLGTSLRVRVRVPGCPPLWADSSVGRTRALQARGRGFETRLLLQTKCRWPSIKRQGRK